MNPLLIVTSSVFCVAFIVVLILLIKTKRKQNTNEITYYENTSKLKKSISVIDEKNNDFESSVIYAKRLVDAIFKIGSLVEFNRLDYFLMYHPKDIISGDFVWHNSKYDRHYFAVADCTGHGVPGAFMSIISYNLLNQAINEYGFSNPSEILTYVNQRHYEIFNLDNDSHIRDGMDIGICVIDTDSEIIEYAGAMRSLYLVTADGKFEKLKGDRLSIGELHENKNCEFTDHVVEFMEGDTVYLTSDGFGDQFGGLEGKKFRTRKFIDLLIDVSPLSTADQKEMLENTLNTWMGDYEQNDDITVLGIKFQKYRDN